MTGRIKLRYACVAVALGVAALAGSQLARLLGAAACAAAVVSAEVAYRVALLRLEDEVEKWHSRWHEEHEKFLAWMRADRDVRRS